jgi:hypothetical protein
MENQARKKSVEVLSEIYRNAQLALESISDILPAAENDSCTHPPMYLSRDECRIIGRPIGIHRAIAYNIPPEDDNASGGMLYAINTSIYQQAAR